MYERMHRCGDIGKDLAIGFALASVLKACVGVGVKAVEEGMQVHGHVMKYGCYEDVRVQTKLIDFYGKCGLMEEAERVFDRMSVRDVQAWNTLISGFVKDGNMEAAKSFFKRMPNRNDFTWEAMISGYANVGRMDDAQKLFDELLEDCCELDMNAVVCTAMITGYAKCGDIEAARRVFDGMFRMDVVSWTAMISAYCQAGLYVEAVDLFKLMLKIGGETKPNESTVSSVVSACTHLGSVELARWIKEYIYSRGKELLNTHTVTALIDMHAKCGEPDEAYELFKQWKDKDIVCYSTMIAGFVLSACSHAGLVNEGCRYFDVMQKEYSILPTADHYMCMVDLLGGVQGLIADAYRTIVEVMPPVEPNAGVWGALLSACRVHHNVEIGEIAAKHLLEIEPENAGNYVLLASIYAKARKWKQVEYVRGLMKSRGATKSPGLSRIEIGGRSHKFRMDDIPDHLSGEDLVSKGYSTFPSIEHGYI
ncbi:hypothetical protein IFM89_008873 [Coptis chinensis]|uniref:Pentatricopeptide repeat-containing protein n=1 Tax=Coptis chinensis TaxID=261450 RepID=A0A835HUE9_9MAGN|nr:hypothetical protein IFM89_008873 [Coptis chinensis]